MTKMIIELMKDKKTIYIHQNGNDFFLPIEELEKMKTEASASSPSPVASVSSRSAVLKNIEGTYVYNPDAEWKTANGTVIKVADMNDVHLQNAFKMCIRKHISFKSPLLASSPVDKNPMVMTLRGEILHRKGYC